jgi:DNA-binding response OmpR family regulator
MSNFPKILLVEDDDFSVSFVKSVLSSDYEVLHVETGQAALDFIKNDLPDLVLLDVNMPGMSGYEVCRALRDDDDIGTLPVIFLSGLASDEERLAGYEAGGDDYLAKPASADELRTKIKLQVAIQAERSRLKEDLSNAFTTAMTAMSSTAEIGVALQFLRTSFTCSTYAVLCREVLNTLSSYGLEASVQIRGQQGVMSVGANGPCSPLEESVLTNMSKNGRLFEFASRTSCSYDHVTIIVKSVARDDPEGHGRMKDNLAMVAEGADARVAALDSHATMARQHAALIKLTASTRKALQSIERRHREQGIKNNEIFQVLQQRFDSSMLSIGITESQEEELAQLILSAAAKARALFNEGLETSADMNDILKQLENVDNLTGMESAA